MRRIPFAMIVLASLVLLVSACEDEESRPTTAAEAETSSTETAASDTNSEPSAEEPGQDVEPIYLSIIWHQHQPVYFKDPETDVYVRPWVRVHAAKDYVDMAAILEEYPEVHATFNLTPSLIRQLDDLAAGAKDLYWVHTEIPVGELTATKNCWS
jgi:hypothetical protein